MSFLEIFTSIKNKKLYLNFNINAIKFFNILKICACSFLLVFPYLFIILSFILILFQNVKSAKNELFLLGSMFIAL